MTIGGEPRTSDTPTVVGEFAPSGFFALRTPFLPITEWFQFGAGLTASSMLGRRESLADALDLDRTTLGQRLHDLVLRPEVREALFVASPSLDERIERWLRDGRDPGNKIRGAILRYFARMAGRATPFGLFSGTSLGTLGPETRLSLAARTRYERRTRLDMDYLSRLTEDLGTFSVVRESILYFPNTSLYRIAGRWRYVEARTNRSKRRTHHLVATEATSHLDATIERARNGAKISDLATALVDEHADGEISYNEAVEFIDELIFRHILTSRLPPAITGTEPIHPLISALEALPGGIELAKPLVEVREALTALDGDRIGSAPSRYREIAGSLANLPTQVELSRLYQVDMIKPADATLGTRVMREITRGAMLLQKMWRRPREDNLGRFREAFRQRYGEREVPLVEALDEELGIGFGRAMHGAEHEPLLDDIAIHPPAAEPMIPWGPREALLLEMLDHARATGGNEVALTRADLAQLSSIDPLPLPDAFCVMATVLAASPEAVHQGAFRVHLQLVNGPSGARLLGRFCHADRKLQSYVEAHLVTEEGCRPGAIFAEVAHLPEGRVGNILCRPLLREHEIVFLGVSGASDDCQILVTDLLVTVAADRIVLRSRRLDREVIPRLSAAHNFAAGSLGIYRFLCEVQSQGTMCGLGWNWGPLRSSRFLPRVTHGRLVLSRASWNLSRHDIGALASLRDGALFEAVSRLRADRNLPRWVALVEDDNELPVDLENVLSVEALVQVISTRPTAALVEMFTDDLCVRGPEGEFVHELVVPFARTPGEVPKSTRTVSKSRTESRQTFPPGSEWMYAKIYTGTATADRILTGVVRPVVARAIRAGVADSWFFTRFADPDWHLRVRFAGEPARLHSHVFAALQLEMPALVESGAAWRIQLDTYEREVERYGGPEGIAISERIFQADSNCAIAMVALLANAEAAEAADARWRLALLGMDMLLDDLGLSLDAKLAIVARMRSTAFRGNSDLSRTVGTKFRQETKSLELLLERMSGGSEPLSSGMAILEIRSKELGSVVAELRAAEKAQRLTLPISGLAPSYLHMFANRLLRAEARAQELVLYDFLARLYSSRGARARQ